MTKPSSETTMPEPRPPLVTVTVSPGFKLEYPRSLVRMTTTAGLTFLNTLLSELAPTKELKPTKLTTTNEKRSLERMMVPLFSSLEYQIYNIKQLV
jgi:hypothetical protein